MLRYCLFFLVQRNTFTMASVLGPIAALVSSYPSVASTIAAALVLAPLVDLFSTTLPGKQTRRCIRGAILFTTIGASINYYYAVVFVPNTCDSDGNVREQRRSMSELIAFAIASAMQGLWALKLIAIFWNKLDDVRRPAIAFRLKPGIDVNDVPLPTRDGAERFRKSRAAGHTRL
jgi:hypothetical protein